MNYNKNKLINYIKHKYLILANEPQHYQTKKNQSVIQPLLTLFQCNQLIKNSPLYIPHSTKKNKINNKTQL